jgi:hypothetical protein
MGACFNEHQGRPAPVENGRNAPSSGNGRPVNNNINPYNSHLKNNIPAILRPNYSNSLPSPLTHPQLKDKMLPIPNEFIDVKVFLLLLRCPLTLNHGLSSNGSENKSIKFQNK